MAPVQYNLSKATWSLVRRGPPPVSQRNIATIIGVSTAGVSALAILIISLVYCRKRRLLASEEKGTAPEKGNTPRSPAPSFIQYPPMLVRTSDTISDVRSTLYSPNSMSKAISEEGHLEGAISWPTHVRPKFSQDSGLGGSPPPTSTTSYVEEGSALSGMTAINVSLDVTPADEGPKSTYSTVSSSPLLKSSFLPLVYEESSATKSSSGSLVPPPVLVTEPSPETRRERAQRHTSRVADSEPMSVRSTSKTRSTSSNVVTLPYNTFPGLPSSPVASLALSRMTLEKDDIPPVPHNPYTSSAFLDSPHRKSRQGSHPRNHSRSLSQPSVPSRLAAGQVSSKKYSSETKYSQSNYASVAYAREKALDSPGPRSRSALASVRTPTTAASRADALPATPRSSGREHTPMDMQFPKPDKELLALLSTRSRTRPRSHSWSISGEAPEMI